jgi:prepilin-type N-terminal cleavage/methylation domain-containing protein
MQVKNKCKQGFTLVEMAVVLAIFGLLIGGLLTSLSAQVEQRSREETRVVLENAKEALIGFVISNKYLPCPDVSTVPNGLEGARSADNKCTVPVGVLPWRVLGVRGTDAWGRYLKYHVSRNFTDDSNFFTLSETGEIEVNGEVGTLAESGLLVVMSFGPNGLGGKNTIQSFPENQLPSPAGAHEISNANSAAVYISKPPSSADGYDDIVGWISPNLVMNRMVAAGQLP